MAYPYASASLTQRYINKKWHTFLFIEMYAKYQFNLHFMLKYLGTKEKHS